VKRREELFWIGGQLLCCSTGLNAAERDCCLRFCGLFPHYRRWRQGAHAGFRTRLRARRATAFPSPPAAQRLQTLRAACRYTCLQRALQRTAAAGGRQRRYARTDIATCLSRAEKNASACTLPRFTAVMFFWFPFYMAVLPAGRSPSCAYFFTVGRTTVLSLNVPRA